MIGADNYYTSFGLKKALVFTQFIRDISYEYVKKAGAESNLKNV